MSTRAPVLLSITLLLLLVVHYLILPEAAQQLDPVVFRPISGEQVAELELTTPGVKIVAQGETKPPNVAINSYLLVQPYRKTADRTAVADVLNMVYRLQRFDALDATDEQLEKTGLKNPTLVMTLKTTHRTLVIRFGKPEGVQKENYEYVYCQVDGDPRYIYHWFKGYYDSLCGPADHWRTRQVVNFQSHLVNKIWIESRADAKLQFTKTELTLGEGRQWWLTEPYKDRAEPDRVNLVFDVLTQLRAEKFTQSKDPVELKLDGSLLKVHLFTVGSTQPVEVTVSAFTETGEGKDKKRFAHVFVQGADEAAWVDATRIVNEFPGLPEIFRPKTLFNFPDELVEKIEIYCHALGRVLLEKRIELRPSRRQGQAPVKVAVWKLLDPPGFEEPEGSPERAMQEQKIAQFVNIVRMSEVLTYAGFPEFQDNDKRFTEPECRLTFTLKKGKDSTEQKAFFLETKDTSALCYVPLGPNRYEMISVQRMFVDGLKRLEWNFYSRAMLQIDASKVLQLDVDAEGAASVKIVKTAEGWQSTGANETRKLSEDNLQALLEKLRNLTALQYIAKVGPEDQKTPARFGLVPPELTLRIHVEKDGRRAEHVLWIGGLLMGDLRAAKLKDSPIVFQISPDVIELVQKLHVRPW